MGTRPSANAVDKTCRSVKTKPKSFVGGLFTSEARQSVPKDRLPERELSNDMKTTRYYRRRKTFPLAVAAAAVWLGLAAAQGQKGPAITQQPATQIAAPASAVSLSVAVSGAGPFLYQWRFNGSNLPALIATVAGNGSNGYSGDGLPATNAALSGPTGVAVDGAGNLFIADYSNSRVRVVMTNGIIATFAGSGATNFYGDGNPATNAGLSFPVGVALDNSGNVLICDQNDGRIRQVDTNGIITTVAGGGTNKPGDGGAATNATLNHPQGVAVDALGNLFIADSNENRVRKVGANGIITTVAGGGTNIATNGVVATNADIFYPAGVAVDGLGNLFVSFSNPGTNGGLLKVATNGIISVPAPGGFFSQFLRGSAGLAVDGLGDLFISVSRSNVVLEELHNGVLLPQTAAGTVAAGGYFGDGGPANRAGLLNPAGLAVDAAGDLFIADEFNNRIREVAAQGPTLALADVSATNAGSYDVVVSSPYGSVTSSVATLFVGYPVEELGVIGGNLTLSMAVTNAGPLIYQWQFDGTNLPVIITTVAGDGGSGESGDGGMATNAMLFAGGVAADGAGNFYIADSANDRVRKVDSNDVISTVAGDGTAGFSGDGGAAANASLFNPAAVAVDASGDLFIADELNNRVREVGTNGLISTVAGDGTNGFSGDGATATNASLSGPAGLALDGSGDLFISDAGNNRVREVGTNGLIGTVAGNGTNGFSGDGGPATNASLSNPAGLAVDAWGNLFIADSGNKRIRKVATNGVITTVAGNGDAGYYGDGGPATNAFLESPAAVAVDLFGNLFIADSTEHVRQVAPNGVINTVAGNAGFGYSGDGGPPTNARLSDVYGVAVDTLGDLFIADTGNNRIRKVTAFGPGLSLGNFTLGQAGLYDLVVSNSMGSVTSAVIQITPVLAPLSATLQAGPVTQIQFTGTPGSNYVVETTTDLAAPANWQPLSTNAAAANGSGLFIDTNTQAYPARFYRLALP
jgi:sugar lactone lactonase YvrE